MDLHTYLRQQRGLAAELAAQVGVRPVMISQWASRKKPVPTARAAHVEKATGGVVRRWDLRPDDWHVIWPELIGVPGAPAADESEGA